MPPAPDHVHSGFLEEAGPTLLITLSPQLWNSRYGNVSYGFPEIDLCIHIKEKTFGEAMFGLRIDQCGITPYPFKKLISVGDETSSVSFPYTPCSCGLTPLDTFQDLDLLPY